MFLHIFPALLRKTEYLEDSLNKPERAGMAIARTVRSLSTGYCRKLGVTAKSSISLTNTKCITYLQRAQEILKEYIAGFEKQMIVIKVKLN